MKKWKCSVCNYTHEGDEPLAECPVCGADKDKFIEVTESSIQSENRMEVEAPVDTPSTIYEKITALILDKHLHPISVHGPNGIIPMAVVFLVFAVVVQLPGFGSAAYLSMIFVLLGMPPVILTGYLTWQKKYKGAKTSLFKMKIAASCVATGTLFGLILSKTNNTTGCAQQCVIRSFYFPFLVSGHACGNWYCRTSWRTISFCQQKNKLILQDGVSVTHAY